MSRFCNRETNASKHKTVSEQFLNFSRTPGSPENRFLVKIHSVVELILAKGEGGPENEIDSTFKN
jgi:hypothetical protein